MTMRGTAALVAVLVILAGWLWLAEAPRPAVEPAPPLLAVPTSAVARVELEEPGGRLTFVRSADAWRDDEGRPWRSDGPRALLDALTTLRPVTVVADGAENVDEYGFGRDASRLRVYDDDNHVLLGIDIGRRNPAWTGVYARREGEDAVLLVGGLLRWELEKLRNTAPTARIP